MAGIYWSLCVSKLNFLKCEVRFYIIPAIRSVLISPLDIQSPFSLFYGRLLRSIQPAAFPSVVVRIFFPGQWYVNHEDSDKKR